MSPQSVTFTFDNERTGELDGIEMSRIQEICAALVGSGGVTGVKQGRTLLHFDAEGSFMGVELQYWPWRKRKA